jgi:hypothetical protein
MEKAWSVMNDKINAMFQLPLNHWSSRNS